MGQRVPAVEATASQQPAQRGTLAEARIQLVDSKASGLKFTVPAREFTEAMLLAFNAAVDDVVTLSGDARGVLQIRFSGRGADHSILIASVLADGSRSSADLFQRYDKTCA